jgi:hypothetical protein
MKKKLLAMAGAALLSLSPLAPAQQSSTQEVVRAADSFLAILTPDQRQKVMYAFDDAAQRARWSNFPTGVVARGGIGLKQMTTAQQDAAMKLMATLLSPMGMQKVSEIREADDDFKANGSKRGRGGTRSSSARPASRWTERPRSVWRARTWWPSHRRRSLRQRSLLHLLSWHSFHNRAVDAAVRRPPSGAEYYD